MKITRQKLKQIISEELKNLGEGWFSADTSDLQRDYETPAERKARMQREYDEKQAEADRLRRAYEETPWDPETPRGPETFQGAPDPSQWPDPDEGEWGEFEGDIVDPGEHPETTEFDIEAELGDLPRSTQAKVLRALQSPETTEFDVEAELGGLPRSTQAKVLRALESGDLQPEPRPSRRPRAATGPRLAGLGGAGGIGGGETAPPRFEPRVDFTPSGDYSHQIASGGITDPTPGVEPRPRSRGDARAMARSRGELQYTYKGKKYGTRGYSETPAQWKRKMARNRAGEDKPTRPAMFEEGQQKNSTKITKAYLEQIIKEELGKLI